MTPQEAAAALHGNEYTKEGSKELFAEMKAAGLVAVYAASDDLVELEGAIDDELDAYGGTTFHVDGNGLVKNDCAEGKKCPNWKPRGKPIEAIWCPEGEGEGSWGYRTEIPHATFDIMDEGELYCRGIVFALADAA
jgi:hypothetical protein